LDRSNWSLAYLLCDLRFQCRDLVGDSDPHYARVVFVSPPRGGSLKGFHRCLSGKFPSRHGDLPGLNFLAMDFHDQRSLGRCEGAFARGDLHDHTGDALHSGQLLAQRDSVLVIETNSVIFVILPGKKFRRDRCRELTGR